MMAASVGIGVVSVYVGLLASYHLDLAAGAAMSGVAVAGFFVVLAGSEARATLRRRPATGAVPATAGAGSDRIGR